MKVVKIEDDHHTKLKIQAASRGVTMVEHLGYLITTEAKRIKAKELIKGK